jgi:cysteine desulfurase
MRRIVRIYLDYNATAPAPSAVIDAVATCLRDTIGNPSSVHAFGQRARGELDRARVRTAALIDADPGEIVFTSGGTEANNLAIRGAFESAGTRDTANRHRIVTTGIEHEAVLNTVRALGSRGAEIVIVPATPEGIVDLEAVKSAVDRHTLLVSVMLANNEIGTVQPVPEIAAHCKAQGVLFHTDAVQAASRMPISVRTLGADLVSISAHKFGGPKGAGALWVRRGVKLTSHMTGGRQERNRRAGTENLPGIVGMGVAAELAASDLSLVAGRLAGLRDRLENGILATVPGTVVNGGPPRIPNTTNISFDGIEAESLLIALDLEGIAVSTGSACSSGTLEPSHVLRAMGLPNSRARNSLRFSLGPSTTAPEVERVIEVLPAIVAKLRRLGRTIEALR